MRYSTYVDYLHNGMYTQSKPESPICRHCHDDSKLSRVTPSLAGLLPNKTCSPFNVHIIPGGAHTNVASIETLARPYILHSILMAAERFIELILLHTFRDATNRP